MNYLRITATIILSIISLNACPGSAEEGRNYPTGGTLSTLEESTQLDGVSFIGQEKALAISGIARDEDLPDYIYHYADHSHEPMP